MTEHDCYYGQWSIHPPHDYESYPTGQPAVRGKAKTVTLRCPGKTRETVLGYSEGTRVFETESEFMEWRGEGLLA